MNYRHAFHAGNWADVVKHTVLVMALRRMVTKPKPLMVLDTHAGAGLYELAHGAALRSGEHRDGIGRALTGVEAPGDLGAYLDLVRGLGTPVTAGNLARYPGSPVIAQALLRPTDRLVLYERHPDDVGALRAIMAGDRRVRIHDTDGWRAVKAHLPPAERRALVLIDPPYEQPGDLDRLAQAIATAWRRFPAAVVLGWYPIKDRAAIWALHERVTGNGVRDVLAAEMLIWPEDTPRRLNGCGLIIVNPPWPFRPALDDTLAALHTRFGSGHGGGTVSVLTPE